MSSNKGYGIPEPFFDKLLLKVVSKTEVKYPGVRSFQKESGGWFYYRHRFLINKIVEIQLS